MGMKMQVVNCPLGFLYFEGNFFLNIALKGFHSSFVFKMAIKIALINVRYLLSKSYILVGRSELSCILGIRLQLYSANRLILILI